MANSGDVGLVDVVLTDAGVTVDCDPGTHGDQPLPSTLAVDAEVDWSEWSVVAVHNHTI